MQAMRTVGGVLRPVVGTALGSAGSAGSVGYSRGHRLFMVPRVPKPATQSRSTSLVEALLDIHEAPDLFAGLDAATREEVLAAGSMRQYGRGEQVFTQGRQHSGVLVIIEGEVRSYHLSPLGREITLAYWSRGHFVGGPEIFGRGVHSWSGVATQESELLFLSGKAIRSLALRLPTFSLNVIEALVFKSKCFSALLQLVGTRSSRALLAHMVLVLGRASPGAGDDRVALDVRYSQDELAKMIGATRQWVAASLSKMRQSGLIEVSGGHITIISARALRKYAEMDG